MDYYIEVAALVHKGLIRSTNQDNLWCIDTYLESENEGMPQVLLGGAYSSAYPAFAVFDGMGGEQQGEMAAYLAAHHFDSIYRNSSKEDAKNFLLDACREINKEICDFQKEHLIRHMGTTAAIILFGQKEVFICNVGDSRVYKYSNKTMVQISQDHVEARITDRKAPLTQNLGVPETEFLIDPYVAKGDYNIGDRYLLCSDGLTDMVSEQEIVDIFARSHKTKPTAQILVDEALAKGGVDNITVIVCEVRKRKRWLT
ncbi:MAG: protein phosphatase 2C domain-containing protein [Peptococcaceae bacterium]|nr:protein phosphatase 2C domain-containing protein [Peptococcaceae bacterium]